MELHRGSGSRLQELELGGSASIGSEVKGSRLEAVRPGSSLGLRASGPCAPETPSWFCDSGL